MGNPLGDVNAQIQAFIVAYNSGKVRDIFASGEISILDDFPPYVCIGGARTRPNGRRPRSSPTSS